MYLSNWGFGNEGRSFIPEDGASFGEVVIGEIAVHDECNLDGCHLSFAEGFSFLRFGLLPHFFKGKGEVSV